MSEPDDPSTQLPPPPSSGEPPGAGRNRRLGPIAPVLVAILAASALGSVYYFFTRGTHGRVPTAAGSSAPRKTGVAILPFPPVPGAEEVAWVGEAAFYFLPLALEDSTELRVLSPERLRDLAKGDLPAAPAAQRDLAKRGGADFFLTGEVSGKSGEAHIKARWIEAASGEELESWEVDGIRPDNLGIKLDEIYTRLRQGLRLASGGIHPTAAGFPGARQGDRDTFLPRVLGAFHQGGPGRVPQSS